VLTAGSTVYLAMVATWLLAACIAGSAIWLRWVFLAVGLVVLPPVRIVAARRTRLPPLILPLAILSAYGVVLGLTSRAPALALAKCVTFATTVGVCLVGGTLLVERFGRTPFLSGWRLAWRLFLALAVAGTVTNYWRHDSGGVYGPTGNPNQFASIVCSLSLVLFADAWDRRSTKWLAVETALGAYVLLATRARASMAAIAVGTAVAILVAQGRGRWLAVGGVLLVLAAAAAFVPEQTVERASDVLEIRHDSDVWDTRRPAWETSFDAMVAGLPFGFGWGVKLHGGTQWEGQMQALWHGREEGTSWLPVGEELGFPGMILMGWLWVALARSAMHAPRSVRRLSCGGLAFFFTLATFEGWLLSPGNWESMAFWTFVGVMLARPVAGLARSDAPPLPPPRGTS
jgi:hypothetical protein